MKEEWRHELGHWLQGFPWKWFCTLTFRPGRSESQARRLVRAWADALREALGTRDFGWFAVREFGRTGQDLHYHALVKGLSQYHADERVEWMRRWWRMAGEAQIEIYAPDAGGVKYILKQADPSIPDAIEIEIQAELFPGLEPVGTELSK